MINNSVAIESYMFDEKSESVSLDREFAKSPDILHIGKLHWSYWFGEPDESEKHIYSQRRWSLVLAGVAPYAVTSSFDLEENSQKR